MSKELIDRLRDWGGGNALGDMAADAIERLERENAALQQDAERYKFLRNLPVKNDRNIGGDIHFTFAVSRPEPNQWCIDSKRGDQMDAAIDKARGQT